MRGRIRPCCLSDRLKRFPQAATLSPMEDKILIQGLEVRCIIGTLPRERRKKQKIVIDLEFPAPVRRAARRDNLKDALDYQKIAEFVTVLASQSKFYLLETLAERLAAQLLKEFPLKSMILKVTKPGAIRNAQSVSVRVEREKK